MPTIQFLDSSSNPLPGSLQCNIYTASTNTLAASGFLADPHNLAPDFNIALQTQWTTVSGGFYISSNAGPNAISAFLFKGNGSPSGYYWAACPVFNVIPGQTYTFGAYIDPSNVTNGSCQIGIYDSAVSTPYATLSVSNGTAGLHESTWTCPDSVTQVRFVFDTTNCTVANGKTLLCTQPFFQAQSGTIGLLSSTLNSATEYYATFAGNWGPDNPSPQFLGNASTVTIPNYVAPTQSAIGYANAILNLFPRGWLSDSAKSSGGNAYNIALALAQYLLTVDGQFQAVKSVQRPQSSLNGELDSWVTDFLGTTLPRNPNESDTAYYARVQANLAARKGTVSGVQFVAGSAGSTIVTEPWLISETGAYDVDGTIAYNAQGMYGDYSPLIEVWITNNPNLAPNSDSLSGWTITNGGVIGNGGPGGATDYEYTSTGYSYLRSPVVPVVPGETYSLSAWADASQVTGGNPFIGIYDVSLYSLFKQAILTNGSAAQPYATPSWTCPTNVAPTSDSLSGWSVNSNMVKANGGPGGANDFEYIGTGVAATGNIGAWSSNFSVVPGTTYTPSWFVDFSQVTHGYPDLQIFDVNGITIYDNNFGLSPGAVASRYAGPSFTVPKNLVTNSDLLNSGSGWHAEGSGWSITANGPILANGSTATNAWTISGTGSPSQNVDVDSAPIPVNIGDVLTCRGWVSYGPNVVTSGNVAWALYHCTSSGVPTNLISRFNATQASGAAYVLGGATVPSTNYTGYVTWVAWTGNATIASGQSVYFSAPSIYKGSTTVYAYISDANPQAFIQVLLWSGQSGGFIANNGGKVKFSQPMLVAASSASGYISSENPKVTLILHGNNATVASGQQLKFAQPMLRSDGVSTPYYSSTVSSTQEAQLKSNIMAARPGGVNTTVYSVDGNHNASQL